jgi:uncharacterized membrane protein YeaQ/YmgE (transglycosylase-associated protein family)
MAKTKHSDGSGRQVAAFLVGELILPEMTMLIAIIVGILAGFLAGKIMNGSGYGLFADLLLGIGGGIVGRIVLGFLGIGSRGLIGSILISTLGAMVLIWVVRALRSDHGET